MKCEQEGCKERASAEYWIEGYDPVPVFHFCDEHAAKFRILHIMWGVHRRD